MRLAKERLEILSFTSYNTHEERNKNSPFPNLLLILCSNQVPLNKIKIKNPNLEDNVHDFF